MPRLYRGCQAAKGPNSGRANGRFAGCGQGGQRPRNGQRRFPGGPSRKRSSEASAILAANATCRSNGFTTWPTNEPLRKQPSRHTPPRDRRARFEPAPRQTRRSRSDRADGGCDKSTDNGGCRRRRYRCTRPFIEWEPDLAIPDFGIQGLSPSRRTYRTHQTPCKRIAEDVGGRRHRVSRQLTSRCHYAARRCHTPAWSLLPGIQKRQGVAAFLRQPLGRLGGVDGTRTRDPRRDRPVF